MFNPPLFIILNHGGTLPRSGEVAGLFKKIEEKAVLPGSSPPHLFTMLTREMKPIWFLNNNDRGERNPPVSKKGLSASSSRE